MDGHREDDWNVILGMFPELPIPSLARDLYLHLLHSPCEVDAIYEAERDEYRQRVRQYTGALTRIVDDIVAAEASESDLTGAALSVRRKEAQRAIREYRKEILAEGHILCGICGEPVATTDLSIDHIVPISRKGTDEWSNLQPAHKSCNSRKSNRLPWRAKAA